MRHVALCLLIDRSSSTQQLLLGHKKRGFGLGKYVGIGGGLEEGESAAVAAIRETKEEISVEVAKEDLRDAGHITFLFPAKPSWNHYIYLFTADRWQGEPKESEEIKPFWVPVDQIPFQKMWNDASYWLPQVVAGAAVDAHFTFKDDNEHVAHATVELIGDVDLRD